ncbi:MAG TPA: protein phosphatase 2C domain-containing protein [Dermatophilaceae bacterium]|nr:protein phosphatase 2C domain-containing protein [Dermatophilaceae bacterium]
MPSFHVAARSDVGMVRSNNEDSAYAGPHLLAMADGMGGHAGGDVASSTVVGALVELDGEALSSAEATDALLARIAEANAELGARVREEPELDGMGTTLIAMLRAGDRLVLAHIGDSRAFLARAGQVTQLTKDHSFVQNLVDEGRITADEAMTHPQRSLVTRVLTGDPRDEPDVVVRKAQVGDRYLIASDGLTDYVARETVEQVLLSEPEAGRCAERLVDLALRAGAPDNVTVVVGDVVDETRGDPVGDHPQVVGAAAVPRVGTRPIPVTPAEKAAALTDEATGGRLADGPRLAEEGPPSRGGRLARVLGSGLLALVVLAGGSYAAWAWSQQRIYVATEEGYVAVFRGLNSTLGPIALSHATTRTDISLNDLPTFYREKLDDGIDVDTPAAADDLLEGIRHQAQACTWARDQGRECRTVSPGWTPPTPTPTPSPSGSPTPSGSSPSSPPATPTPAVPTA